MRLITHRSHLDALPVSDFKSHIQARFDQLSEDPDVPPNIVLVEDDDDISGPNYAFVGLTGLRSCFCSKWTRKWTCIVDVWIQINSDKYTSNRISLPKAASCKHLCTDRYRKFTAL